MRKIGTVALLAGGLGLSVLDPVYECRNKPNMPDPVRAYYSSLQPVDYLKRDRLASLTSDLRDQVTAFENANQFYESSKPSWYIPLGAGMFVAGLLAATHRKTE